MMASPFLHVANGTSTTLTLQVAEVPGACSIWADPLYEGPVPGALSDEDLVDVRRQYLAGLAGAQLAGSGNDSSLDPVNDLRQWRAAIERYESYDELVLWYEHDLFDQLNLIQLLTWIRERLPATKPVTLVCLGSFPGRPDFKGLGELTPAELESLLDTRQPVGPAQYELARRAWQAFREPTPEVLDALRQGHTDPLPFLAAALARFLQEYPWTTDGLSRSERRLLTLASGDGIALSKAFGQMHEGERAYYITDRSLAALAESLSRSSPPLLALEVSDRAEGPVLRAVVRLTETGRSVLARRVDRISACGIDRWFGGVHLHRGSRIWRWDDQRRRVV